MGGKNFRQDRVDITTESNIENGGRGICLTIYVKDHSQNILRLFHKIYDY